MMEETVTLKILSSQCVESLWIENVSLDSTVEDIKTMILDDFDFYPTFIFDNERLESARTLRSYGVKADSVKTLGAIKCVDDHECVVCARNALSACIH